jgi:rubrerythrin
MSARRKKGRGIGKAPGRQRPGFALSKVLAAAAHKERAAWKMYTDLAERIEDAGARGLLKDLAAEEKRHLALVSRLAKTGRAGSVRITGVAADLHITEYLNPVRLSPRSSFQEVLIHAMKRELEAVEAYAALAHAITDAGLRRTCLFLAGQERAHKLKLERFYDDVIYREN